MEGNTNIKKENSMKKWMKVALASFIAVAGVFLESVGVRAEGLVMTSPVHVLVEYVYGTMEDNRLVVIPVAYDLLEVPKDGSITMTPRKIDGFEIIEPAPQTITYAEALQGTSFLVYGIPTKSLPAISTPRLLVAMHSRYSDQKLDWNSAISEGEQHWLYPNQEVTVAAKAFEGYEYAGMVHGDGVKQVPSATYRYEDMQALTVAHFAYVRQILQTISYQFTIQSVGVKADGTRISLGEYAEGEVHSHRPYTVRANTFDGWKLNKILFNNGLSEITLSEGGTITVDHFNKNSTILYSASLVFEYVPNSSGDQSASSIKNVYRLYDRKTNQHFYTSSTQEVALLQSRGWHMEGTAWKVSTSKSGTAVYRVWNTKTGERIFTRHKAEVDRLAARGWKNEGIAFYTQTSGQPIYRLRNKQTGRYLLTVGQVEVTKLIATGQWQNEGTAFYGIQ